MHTNRLSPAARDWLAMTRAEQDACIDRSIGSEPAEYGEDDAECDVAAQLVAADEVGALVSDVRGALGFLRWAAWQDIPPQFLAGFRNLDRQARSLDRAVDTLIEREQRDAA